MSFFSEISKIVGSGNPPKRNYNLLLLGGNSLYIDGITRIVTIQSEQIHLLSKHTLIEINGIDLILRQSSVDSLIISGQINNIHLPNQ